MASNDRAAMQQAIKRLETSFETINGLRGQVQNHKTELLAEWDGMTASAFNSVMDAWDGKIRKILDAQNTLRENLGAARISYEVTEQEQHQAVNAIDQLINNL